MSEEETTTQSGRPTHLWIVGVLGFLWSCGGAFDYLMTQTENEGYMSRLTPEQLEYLAAYPAWVVAFWALAVWAGVLGTLLLLLKKRHAVRVLFVSFLSMIVTTVHNFFLSNWIEVMGTPSSLAFTALIFLFSLGLLLYAWVMKRSGVLV